MSEFVAIAAADELKPAQMKRVEAAWLVPLLRQL